MWVDRFLFLRYGLYSLKPWRASSASLFSSFALLESQSELCLAQAYQSLTIQITARGRSKCPQNHHSFTLGRLTSIEAIASQALASMIAAGRDPAFLPKEIFNQIMELQDSKAKMRSRRVSRHWKQELEEKPAMWRDFELTRSGLLMSFFDLTRNPLRPLIGLKFFSDKSYNTPTSSSVVFEATGTTRSIFKSLKSWSNPQIRSKLFHSEGSESNQSNWPCSWPGKFMLSPSNLWVSGQGEFNK